MGEYERAYRHYSAAASDTAAFVTEARWQQIASLDAWYHSTQDPSLARQLLDESGDYLDRSLADDRAAGLSWRRAHVALERGWPDVATEELARFIEKFPGDPRVAQAAALRGDALLERSPAEAARAYEAALHLARRAQDEALVQRLETALPAAEFQHAESAGESDQADLFRQLAERRPQYENADLALYRSGLSYRAAGKPESAAEAWSQILERYPNSSYARDAELELAHAWVDVGRDEEAARVYERFAVNHRTDPDAADALLRAGELWETAGNWAEADRVRISYIDRHPEDGGTARALLEPIAARTLAQAPPDVAIDEWLEKSPALARFVEVAQRDSTTGAAILAEIDFRRGEEAKARYDAVPLEQPIQESIVAKKEALEALLSAYRACVTRTVAPWAHAATFRIGEALVAFGTALDSVETPAELSETDAAAYREVLQEQAWEFHDQGEQIWSDLLRSVADATSRADSGEASLAESGENVLDDNEWIRRTQQALWTRLPLRFLHFAEVRYPVLHAVPPKEFSE